MASDSSILVGINNNLKILLTDGCNSLKILKLPYYSLNHPGGFKEVLGILADSEI